MSPDDISSFDTQTSNSLPVPEAQAVAVEGGYAAIAGAKGQAAVYSIESDKLEREIAVNEPVIDALWTGSKVVFAAYNGTIKVYEAGSEAAQATEHAGPATGISVHPGGQILASVGSDRSVVFYELETMKRVSRAYADSGK